MEEINDILNFLKYEYNLKFGYFCIYGSYATKTQNYNSDIDLLYIDENIKVPSRINAIYSNINISLYMVSEKILTDDSNGKYGGYFCGKLFNPHILMPKNEKNNIFVNKCIANYFSHILDENICKLNQKYTADEILKNSIKIYIDIYPEYFAYVMRLYGMNNFENIWKIWCEDYISLLMKAELVKEIDNFYYYTINVSTPVYQKISKDYIARFWIFGAIAHSSNLSFYDYYKDKNIKYILNNQKLKKNTEKFLNYAYYFRKE